MGGNNFNNNTNGLPRGCNNDGSCASGTLKNKKICTIN